MTERVRNGLKCRDPAETPTPGFRADCRGSVRVCENLVCISCTEGESASRLTSYICPRLLRRLRSVQHSLAAMIGMPFGKKSPKSELHEFFQLHPGNPVFDIQPKSNPPAEPLFLCTLTCPAIGGPQGLPEQTFTGQGRNKKTAEQYASEKALEFLRQRGLMAPAIVQMPDQKLPLDLQKQLASTQMVPVSLLLYGCKAVPLHASLIRSIPSMRNPKACWHSVLNAVKPTLISV